MNRSNLWVGLGVALILAFFLMIGGCWQLVVGGRRTPVAQVSQAPTSAPITPPTQAPPAPSPAAPQSPTPESGTYSGAEGVKNFQFTQAGHQDCLRRLAAYRDLVKSHPRKDVNSFPESERICPASGSAYKVFFETNGDAVFNCPGHNFRGQGSVCLLRGGPAFTRVTGTDWHATMVKAILAKDCGDPGKALSLHIESDKLKRTSNNLWCVLWAAADFDSKTLVERIVHRCDEVPTDFYSLATKANALGYMGDNKGCMQTAAILAKKFPQSVHYAEFLTGAAILFQGDSDKATPFFIRAGKDFGWPRMFIFLAKRQYTNALSVAQDSLIKLGYSSSLATDFVRVATLSGMAQGGDDEKLGREVLRKGLIRCPKVWPYPTLLYLNGEIDEARLLALTPRYSIAFEQAKSTIGFLQIVRHHQEEGRAALREANLPWDLDTYVARAWLK